MEKIIIIEIKFDASILIAKHEIKEEIRKNSIPLNIEPKSKLFMKYNEDIFADGTYYISPKFSYQVFITKTYFE
ncbi:hypothetical protein H8356DRAFT_1331883 [Neocallimastix lanati (nom. inval.)]|nr:hypothetical protein H8356DRAFT_1331883 [Neocallimastix sp. JGI-2020a]